MAAAGCPSFISTDTWTLGFVGGNAVRHITTNNNGGWGGGTAGGQAVLATSRGVAQFAGHAQVRFGFGQNSSSGTNQTEHGLAVNFNGRGIAGNISVHANLRTTTNNSATTTAIFGNGLS
jgi:hypothetical protein